MKKLILFFLANLICITLVNAQAYSLSWEGQPLEEEVTVWDEPTVEEMEFFVNVTNNSNDVDSIKVERVFIDLMDGVTHLMCWGSCYPPNPDSVFISPLYVVLQPGETSADYEFSGHYLPNGLEGVSIVKYTFFNMSDESESVSILVNYNTVITGDEKLIANNGSFQLFPNPAHNSVNVSMIQGCEKIQLFNFAGQLVLEERIVSNKADMNTSDLESGIYFVKVFSHDNVITRKLVIE